MAAWRERGGVVGGVTALRAVMREPDRAEEVESVASGEGAVPVEEEVDGGGAEAVEGWGYHGRGVRMDGADGVGRN